MLLVLKNTIMRKRLFQLFMKWIQQTFGLNNSSINYYINYFLINSHTNELNNCLKLNDYLEIKYKTEIKK